MSKVPGRPVYPMLVLMLAAIPFMVLAMTLAGGGRNPGRSLNSAIMFGASLVMALTLVGLVIGLYRRTSWAWYGGAAALVAIVIAGLAAIAGAIYTVAAAVTDPFGMTRFAALALATIGVGLALPAALGFRRLSANPPAGTFRSAPQGAIVVVLMGAVIVWTWWLGPVLFPTVLR